MLICNYVLEKTPSAYFQNLPGHFLKKRTLKGILIKISKFGGEFYSIVTEWS